MRWKDLVFDSCKLKIEMCSELLKQKKQDTHHGLYVCHITMPETENFLKQ